MLLIDADAHYYEPPDCFTGYIEPSQRHLAVRAERRDDGTDVVMIGERPALGHAIHFTHEVAPRPGGLKELFRSGGDADRALVDMQPTFIDPAARVEMLDELGFAAQLLYPTSACLVWSELGDDRDLIVANFRAFNRWLHETWSFDYKERLFAAPLLSLIDVDFAVEQLDWFLEKGARAVCIPPMPPHGRHPADPCFDPVWSRLAEAGTLVVLHVGESGYVERDSPAWGEDSTAAPFLRSTFQWTSCYNDRPIMDFVAAMVFGNLFARFPGLRVASIENGSMWVPYLLRLMDKKRNIGALGPWIGGRVKDKPSETFRRHFSVAPFPEENWPELMELLGPENVLFGSDFPHPEGLATPGDWEPLLQGADDDAVAKVMGANAAALLGIPTA
jgi:predicted TIM-barrel fold metal-dependent hydrolase